MAMGNVHGQEDQLSAMPMSDPETSNMSFEQHMDDLNDPLLGFSAYPGLAAGTND
jgi:hypothetical protein